MTIKSYNSDAISGFQKKAISEKGGDMQRDILKSALTIADAGEYISWLEQQLRAAFDNNADIIVDGDEPTLPAIPPKYTPQEFKEFPSVTAEHIWQTWKDVNPGVFCSSGVWAYIVSQFILQEKIKPFFLMTARDNGKSDGKREIENALEKGDAKQIDKCTRTFLRRLSGLQVERGARSVYQDCPPAVAWWQHYIAGDVAENIGHSKNDILKLFRTEKQLWEVLTDKMASQLTVIGDVNIRDGVILFYLEHGQNHAHVFRKSNIVKTLDALGVMSAWRALGIFEPQELCEVIYNDIYPTLPLEPPKNAKKE